MAHLCSATCVLTLLLTGAVSDTTATSVAPNPEFLDMKKHVEVGDNINLNCKVNVDHSKYFRLDMFFHGKNMSQIGRYNCDFRSETDNNKDKNGFLKCNIHNVTRADEGLYTCHISMDHGVENNVTHNLKVYDKGTSYVNLTLDDEEVTVIVGQEGPFIVHINAHPEVQNITWFRGKKKINNSSRTVIKNDPTMTALTIINYTVWDSGVYEVEVSNKYNTSRVKFPFTVLDDPNVSLRTRESYQYNVTHQINCSVVGNPSSTIKWFGKFCGLHLRCHHPTSVEYDDRYYTISKGSLGEYEQVSTLKITATESGQITCFANNTEQNNSSLTKNFVTSDIPTDEKIWFVIDNKVYKRSFRPLEKDMVVLNCGVPVALHTSNIVWYKEGDVINNTSEYKVFNTSSKFSYRSSVKFYNISKKHEGRYTCSWQNLDGHSSTTSLQLKVSVPQPPFFLGNSTNQSTWSVYQTTQVTWHCYILGTPKPKIIWYKGDEILKIDVNDTTHVALLDDNSTLTMKFTVETDEGDYKCKGINKYGNTDRTFTLNIKDKKSTSGLTIGIVILVLILLALLVFLVYKIREAQKIKRDLIATGLHNFEDGGMEHFNPDLPLDEQAELLPYDKKWEFPRDRLKLGRQLGAGAFGVVRKAEAWGIAEGESVTTVAVKMVKSADLAYIKALASELKIMLHLGRHVNVVNLLGACTDDLKKKEFLVIVEYCRFGNLQNFLVRHRAVFLDQLDPATGNIDFSKGKELTRTMSSQSSKSRLKRPTLRLHRGNSSQSMTATTSEEPSSPTINSDMSVCMSPEGTEDFQMLSNNSIQPGWRSNLHGDYKLGHVEVIFTRDLLCWAFQVARGMEYLSARKIMHGDLAARNILLADDNVVKICDFGLAKSMYKSDNYRKKGEGPLPVKWMAIEAIKDRIFSTQSDVWSYGVVLWEMFSLAKTPYPGMEADEKLVNNLTSGYRMECPQYATREIYQLMLDCWNAQPNRRPAFSMLSEQLGAMLQDSVREHYIDLNDTCVALNKKMAEGRSDYLDMLLAPTYENLTSPTFEKPEHHYVNNSEAARQVCLDTEAGSGYMKMHRSSRPSDMIDFSPRGNEAAGGAVFVYPTPPAQKKHMVRSNSSQDSSATASHPLGVQQPADSRTSGSDHASGSSKGAASFYNPNYVGQTNPGAKPQNGNPIHLLGETGKASPDGPQKVNNDYLFMGNNVVKSH